MTGSLLRILLLLSFMLAVLSADYYKVLGVKKNASEKEIKKAYRVRQSRSVRNDARSMALTRLWLRRN